MEYKKRIIDDLLKEKLEYTGAVAIKGPKWCGKTETASQIAESSIDLSDSEMSNNIYLQERQYSKLLEEEKPMLIDEWQAYPEIWNTVKRYVDKSKQFGEFILTGSANPVDDEKLHPRNRTNCYIINETYDTF